VKRIALHVVTGGPRSGKSALIARLTGARESWLGLVNRLPGGSHPSLRALPSGCPCCTARVEMRVFLARTLRELRSQRVLIELGDERHRAALERALAEWPLGQYLEPGRPIRLPDDSRLSTEALEAG
jgi:hypothetical protein